MAPDNLSGVGDTAIMDRSKKASRKIYLVPQIEGSNYATFALREKVGAQIYLQEDAYPPGRGKVARLLILVSKGSEISGRRKKGSREILEPAVFWVLNENFRSILRVRGTLDLSLLISSMDTQIKVSKDTRIKNPGIAHAASEFDSSTSNSG